MTAEASDAFFGLDQPADDDWEVPADVPRDQWKRPLILQPDGSLKAYSRISSLAGQIENRSGLHRWDVRHIVRGMGLLPDVARMAAALPQLSGDRRKDAVTNAALDEYAEAARVAAGEHAEANWGTAIHSLTEPGQEGNPFVPEEMKADVDSYWKAIHARGMVSLASEVFVVVDELEVAGTFDDLYWDWAYGMVIGDKKSGKKNLATTRIQLACYARAKVYNHLTGERTPLIDFLPGWLDDEWAKAEQLGQSLLNLDTALYVHIPAGAGETQIIPIDIALGWDAAQAAAWVYRYKKMSPEADMALEPVPTHMISAKLAEMKRQIDECNDADDMKSVWKAWELIWTEKHSAYAMRVLRAKRAGQ